MVHVLRAVVGTYYRVWSAVVQQQQQPRCYRSVSSEEEVEECRRKRRSPSSVRVHKRMWCQVQTVYNENLNYYPIQSSQAAEPIVLCLSAT